MEESIVDKYYKRLQMEVNKYGVIVDFYRELFGQGFSKEVMIGINRLISVYGYNIVFFSILDMLYVENLDHTEVYRLIAHFAKKRLESNMTINKYTEIDISSLEKEFEKQRKKKLVFRSPFNE